ncbi:isoprenoid synthase domain-containing protein [Infundibulicybe gibba]|nr:isoprenoid synthase domain-containing protein [Infundibulicybe gibba]
MNTPTSFLLPDLIGMCPLKDATNPHYEKAAAESRAWVDSYNIFTDRRRAYFIQGMNELLVSHAYPYAGYEQFRTCCDFVNVLFVVDEVSDDQGGKDAHSTGQVFIKAMEDPTWDDHSALTKITKEFWERFVRLAGSNVARRFLNHAKDYTECVAKEAELRENGEVLDLEDFIALRRENSAVRLCFSLIEYALGTNLPQEVYEDPIFQEIYFAGVDLVCWSNDIYSYDMEQAKGLSGNNVMTVLMKTMTVQEAADYVGVYCKKIIDIYLSAKDRLHLSRYIEAIGSWLIGNLEWSFETQRYFGAAHLDIKRTRLVTLRPTERPEDADSESESDSE